MKLNPSAEVGGSLFGESGPSTKMSITRVTQDIMRIAVIKKDETPVVLELDNLDALRLSRMLGWYFDAGSNESSSSVSKKAL